MVTTLVRVPPGLPHGSTGFQRGGTPVAPWRPRLKGASSVCSCTRSLSVGVLLDDYIVSMSVCPQYSSLFCRDRTRTHAARCGKKDLYPWLARGKKIQTEAVKDSSSFGCCRVKNFEPELRSPREAVEDSSLQLQPRDKLESRLSRHMRPREAVKDRFSVGCCRVTDPT